MTGTLGARRGIGSAATDKRVVLAIILVGYFMILLDNSIVFTGLDRVRDELDLTTSGLSTAGAALLALGLIAAFALIVPWPHILRTRRQAGDTDVSPSKGQ